MALTLFLLPFNFNGCSPGTDVVEYTKEVSMGIMATGFSAAPNKLNGASLYANKCAMCHGALEVSSKRFASPSRINNALNSNAFMNLLRPHINKDEVDAIAWALAGGAPVTPDKQKQYACVPERSIGHSELKRLTKYELINTFKDLMGPTATARLNISYDLLIRDGLVQDFDTIDHGVTSQHVGGYADFADAVADKIVTDGIAMSSIIGGCWQIANLDESCIRNFIASFGAKVFRRPLVSGEIDSLWTMARDAALAMSDPSEAYYALFFYFLQSSEFLYKVESPTILTGTEPNEFKLNPFELATRLSFLVWGTMPDDTLFAMAKDGTINIQSVYAGELERLLASPRAKEHFRHFYEQWLTVPRGADAPNFSSGFLAGLSAQTLPLEATQELQSFMDTIVWKNQGSYKDLMTSDEVFPTTQNLASVYQTQVWDGVSTLRAPAGTRTGLLGRVDMINMNVDQGRPILRGVFINKKILCRFLPPPSTSALPPDALIPAAPSGTQSSRQLYENKTSDPTCMKCHSMINPFGFAMVNYDSIGRFQTQERIFNTSGSFLGSVPLDNFVSAPIDPPLVVNVSGPLQLSDAIGSSKSGPSCLVDQWFQYSMGRMAADNDGCTKQGIYDGLVAVNGSVVNMIRATALSPTFKVLKIKN